MPILSVMIRRKPLKAAKDAGTVYLRPAYMVAPAKIIRGEQVKCLLCHGVPNLILGKGMTGFQPKNKPYKHKEGCKNATKF